MPVSSPEPLVSIILPTYNRAKFLPQAFESIKAQQYADWELIVVDDGSTDNTRELVEELTRGWPQPVRYHWQENQGAYGARNTGLDLARGKYVAFFDSDDIWLPHHVGDCVAALKDHPDVDWAYGACRMVDWDTKRTLTPNTFRVDGKPRELMRLRYRESGKFRVIDDPNALRVLITAGFYCGLQNSVIRRQVFDRMRFETRFRNEAEDVLAAIRVMIAGFRFGYFDNVHVVYHVHEHNSSAAGTGLAFEKSLKVHRAMIEGMENLIGTVRLSRAEVMALRWSFHQLCFWKVGYSLLWQHDRRAEALQQFRRGLRVYPWSLAGWKTYIACRLRSLYWH
jgi:glycosyltransferase involved in cell wall biosynthesis